MCDDISGCRKRVCVCVCDDISMCRRRVCMCVMIYQFVGGECVCV